MKESTKRNRKKKYSKEMIEYVVLVLIDFFEFDVTKNKRLEKRTNNKIEDNTNVYLRILQI